MAAGPIIGPRRRDLGRTRRGAWPPWRRASTSARRSPPCRPASGWWSPCATSRGSTPKRYASCWRSARPTSGYCSTVAGRQIRNLLEEHLMADRHGPEEIVVPRVRRARDRVLGGRAARGARRARRTAPRDVRLVQDLPRAARGDGTGAAGSGRGRAGAGRRPSWRCSRPSANGGGRADRVQVPAPGRRGPVQRPPLAGARERRAGRLGRGLELDRGMPRRRLRVRAHATSRSGSGRSSGRSSSTVMSRLTIRS